MAEEFISCDDFEKIEIRAGTIIEASAFPKAKKPSYKLKIDFGNVGMKQSSAQITQLYTLEDLPGKQVLAVVNFPPKQIADFISECLVLAVYNADGNVVLLQPSFPVANGDKVG